MTNWVGVVSDISYRMPMLPLVGFWVFLCFDEMSKGDDRTLLTSARESNKRRHDGRDEVAKWTLPFSFAPATTAHNFFTLKRKRGGMKCG
jgi:hypothetical protein